MCLQVEPPFHFMYTLLLNTSPGFPLSLGLPRPGKHLMMQPRSHDGASSKITTSVIQVCSGTHRQGYLLTPVGVDFVRRLLQYKPQERMTPANALLHQWIEAEGHRLRRRLLEEDELRQREEARRRASSPGEQCARNGHNGKRKACTMEPDEYLANMRARAEAAEDSDEEPQNAKRSRRDRSPMESKAVMPAPTSMHHLSYDTRWDEVPGLVLSHQQAA